MPDKYSPIVEKWRKREEVSRTFMTQYYAMWKRWTGWIEGELPTEIVQEYAKPENKDKSARLPLLPADVFEDMESKVLGGSIFSIDKFFDFAVRNGLDELEQYIEKNQTLLMLQMEHEEYDFKEATRQVFRDWWTKGIGLMWPEWVIDEQTEFEGFAAIAFDPYRWFPSPTTDHKGRPAFHILKKVVYYSEVVRLVQSGYFQHTHMNELKGSLADFDRSWVDASMIDLDLDKADPNDKKDRFGYPVMLWYCIDSQEMVIIANEKYRMRTEDRRLVNSRTGKAEFLNRDLLLEKLDLMPRFGRIVGKSPMGMIESSCIEYFFKRNRETDVLNLVGPQWETDDSDYANSSYVQMGPGKVHSHKPGTKFTPIFMQDTSILMASSSARVEAEIRRYLNLDLLFTGDRPERRDTLGRDMLLQQNAQGKLSYTISRFENVFIAKILRKGLRLNKDNWPESYTPKYYGNFSIKRDQIKPELMPQLKGLKNATSRQLFAAQGVDIAERFSRIPQIAQFLNYSGGRGWQILGKGIVHGMGYQDADDLFPEMDAIREGADKENYILASLANHELEMGTPLAIDVPVGDFDDHQIHTEVHEEYKKEMLMQIQSGQIEPELGQAVVARISEHQLGHQMKLNPQAMGVGQNGSQNGEVPANVMDMLKGLVPEQAQPQRERVI